MKTVQKRLLGMIFVVTTVAACSDSDISDFKQAEVAFSNHNFYEARIHLLNAISDNPTHAKARLLHAKLMLELGDGIAAENSLNNVPENVIGKSERIAMVAHGQILQGQSRDVIKRLGSDQMKSANADMYRMLIWAHLEEGSLVDHEEILQAGLANFGTDPHINALAARYAIQNEEWDRARQFVLKSLQVDPKNYEALILSGQIAIFDGDLEDAKRYYSAAHSIYPDHAVPLANLAGLEIDLGDIKAARGHVAKGRNIHPNYAFLQFQDARIAYLEGRYREANDLLQAINMPGYAPVLILSGRVAAKLGNHSLAIAQLQRARSYPPFEQEASEVLDEINGPSLQ